MNGSERIILIGVSENAITSAMSNKKMTTQTVRKKYENGEGFEIVFYDKGMQVGKACTANFEEKENSFLHGLEVNKQFRNNGYGSGIVAYMVDKYDVDTLYVANDNIIAIRLYEKFDFKVMKSFNENFIIMKRT